MKIITDLLHCDKVFLEISNKLLKPKDKQFKYQGLEIQLDL